MRFKIAALIVASLLSAAAVLWASGVLGQPDDVWPTHANLPTELPPAGQQLATFGAGCFWCTEAVFQKVKGVHAVQSGYSGGAVKNPTYDEVCSGTTGHAEVIQIGFDPAVVSFAQLLDVFWHTHDPTTPNQQGNDVGSQYRSVIFFRDEEQRTIAERSKRDLDQSGAFAQPIVTEIVPYVEFFAAEAYHQDFFQKHPHHPYCRVVIPPKLKKLQKLSKSSGG
jgi:peptide-methionine (S)-S-oxide reductase